MHFQERNRKIMIEINLRQREHNSEVSKFTVYLLGKIDCSLIEVITLH